MGTAVISGIILVAAIKKFHLKDLDGQLIQFPKKDKRWKKYLIGGAVFGIGWAFTGACPGPVFVLLGHGYTIMLVVIAGALAGTFVYGLIRNRLPH